jgi:glutamine synthetase
MPHLLDEKNAQMLISHGVFSEAELRSRCEIMLENYCKTIIIEANTMVAMARNQILPAVERFTADVASRAAVKKALDATLPCAYETVLVQTLSALTDEMAADVAALEQALEKADAAADYFVQSVVIRDDVLAAMDALRAAADKAEAVTDKAYWPFPTYADLLFSVQ